MEDCKFAGVRVSSTQFFMAGHSSSISVVIPLYNHRAYIYRAVASAYWQLGPNDDIIVIDDGSTDGIDFSILDCFRDRMQLIRNDGNKGCSYTRNVALLNSKAEWIKFLDADDILAPFALNCIHHPCPPIDESVQVITGGCHRMCNGVYQDYINGADLSIRLIRHFNPMLPSATFVRRLALMMVGFFDERIDFEEDWDMWQRLHEHYGHFAFQKVDQPICYYWIEAREREQNSKQRTKMVDGIPVREYFRRRYGAAPWEAPMA